MKMNEFEKLVRAAHVSGAQRNCASTQVLLGSFDSNGGDALKSVIAASMTFGGPHAPVGPTMMFMQNCLSVFEKDQQNLDRFVSMGIDSESKIPGFGSSFVKNDPDPSLSDCHEWFHANLPKESHVFSRVERMMETKKNLFPNLAYYTAILFRYQRVPLGLVEAKLVEFRIKAWIKALEQKVK